MKRLKAIAEMQLISNLSELKMSGYYFDGRTSSCGKGKEGIVFPIDNFAVKIHDDAFGEFLNDSATANDLINQYNISRDLYDNSVSVPVPYGVFLLNSSRRQIYPGFFMDLLGSDYKRLDKMSSGKSLDRAVELRSRELKKVRELGYVPNESMYAGNSMYSESKDDLKIFDVSKYVKLG